MTLFHEIWTLDWTLDLTLDLDPGSRFCPVRSIVDQPNMATLTRKVAILALPGTCRAPRVGWGRGVPGVVLGSTSKNLISKILRF